MCSSVVWGVWQMYSQCACGAAGFTARGSWTLRSSPSVPHRYLFRGSIGVQQGRRMTNFISESVGRRCLTLIWLSPSTSPCPLNCRPGNIFVMNVIGIFHIPKMGMRNIRIEFGRASSRLYWIRFFASTTAHFRLCCSMFLGDDIYPLVHRSRVMSHKICHLFPVFR